MNILLNGDDNMRRNIISFCLINYFVLLIEINTCAQNKLPSVPKCADISINGIFLEDNISIEDILGKDIKLSKPKNDFPQANFLNSDSSQILTLIFHYGNEKNKFSEFRVRKNEEKMKSSYPVLCGVDCFITYKGIKLGISRNDLVRILGDGYKEIKDSDYHVIIYRLKNVEDSQFLKYYNLPSYFGKYVFKNNKLERFSFGFEYP